MRKLLLLVITLVSSLVGAAQSYNERIATAMNTSDWFALDSIYSSAPQGFYNAFSRSVFQMSDW